MPKKRRTRRVRQYYRTAALLGAQQRMSSQKQRRARRVRRIHPIPIPWPVVILTVAVLAIVLWLWRDTRWYVDASRLQVTGASAGTATAVAKASGILELHSLWVHPDESTAWILEQVPAVTEVTMECWHYPAECSIRVKERKPTLIWLSDSMTYWVDAEGYLFPAQGERPDLPVLRGPLPEVERTTLDTSPSPSQREENEEPGTQSSGERIAPEIVESVQALLKVAGDQAAGQPGIIASEGIEYSPRHGLIWNDPEGRRVAFGTGPGMEIRWRMYQALTADLEARGIFPWTLDVRFPMAPTYALDRYW